MIRAWIKAQTRALDLKVMDMKAIVHGTRVEAPTEKMSVEKGAEACIWEI